MTLRAKLLAAQVPLAAAIVALGVVSATAITSLAGRTDLVLRDNFRSVLAGERMKEAAERIDSGAMFLILGRGDLAATQIEANRRVFVAELGAEEHNITEAGEDRAASELHQAWEAYQAELARFRALPAEERTAAYFDRLQPGFVRVKNDADRILEINQDAMMKKSDQALRSASTALTAIIATTLLALFAAAFASVTLTARLLRPLSVLNQAVRRIGEGDLVARARVDGKDEIADLARDFNAMADHLEHYRKSSLGELLLVQSVAQAVIDSLPDPVLVVGLRGELVNANRAAEDVLGVSVEKTPTVAALDATIRPLAEKLSAHVLGGNGPFLPRGIDEAVRVTQAGGGAVFQLLPRATPMYSEEGAVSGATIVLQDVTRLMRFDELKNNLVATVAHEFRTPLTSLRMATHMCVEGAVGELNDKQLDLLTVARDDCERLQSIVDDLLDMSRIQAGKIEIEPRRLSAEALAHEAVDAFQEAARRRGLALRSETLPGLGEVSADPDRVQLVFANLLTNALRHTGAGEVVVRALPADGAVRFEVADTGAGIPLEHQGSIFERFYRVPGASTGGAGLGLFIVKEIVEAHGGAVGFSSEVGKGTTFWFTIPSAASVGG